MAREADDAHVVAEVLATELRPDPGLLGEGQDLCFEIEVTESVTSCASTRRK